MLGKGICIFCNKQYEGITADADKTILCRECGMQLLRR